MIRTLFFMTLPTLLFLTALLLLAACTERSWLDTVRTPPGYYSE